ncbi:hypothetical protein PHMEG_00033305 [Phytophthora megakarya]|uniref:Uncharacterized protein n=1 Tax=Phytophthora megakarya TaxID=4795 RepID=A0A225UTX9_9STRA|nr:hypothetical protein PHMEG_00033305 [Phytophthora megakarya]
MFYYTLFDRDLRDFITNNNMDDPNTRASVRVQGRVLWMRNDQVNNETRSH